jgi:flavin-dependent dehydrogenase
LSASASRPEVVVIGGGPGGSVSATRLAQKGRRVLLLEKAHHPRFHLGESLLPQSLPVLEKIGALDAMRARFIVKRGAQFHEDATRKTARYDFSEAYRPTPDHAFEVPRDEFDEILLRHAASAGVDVREGWTVTRVRFEGTRAASVEAKDESGAAHVFEPRVIVDASGRDALVGRRAGITRMASLDKTALFTQWRGAWRDTGPREGDIQIVVFGAPEPSWFWSIPFSDGRTSFGAVVSGEWMRKNRSRGGPPELFRHAVSESAVATRLLDGAEQIMPAEATADFSFRVSEIAGDGWIAVGDASGFIDPLFSTGALLAMHGGLVGADAIDAALADGDVSRARFAAWEREMRRGAELFIGVVQAFYDGALVPLLFAEKQHPFLRRAITSMLAGDVFDDEARWARDVRTRFPARV